MKTAILIKDDVTQLVLTPENEWEKSVLKSIEVHAESTKLLRGSFYETRGGWDRMSTGDESLMIRVELKSKDKYGVTTVPTL